MPSEPLFVTTNEDPELDAADHSWVRQEPLLSLFWWIHEVDVEEWDKGYADWKISVADKILSKHPQLAERITDWLSFCLNGSSMPMEHSVNAFIDIFVLLALEKDSEARVRLNKAQRECMSFPLPKSNMLVGGVSDGEDDEDGGSDEEADEMSLLETFWEAKLPLWSEALQHSFDTPDKLMTSIHQGAIQALQQMQKITVTTWKQESWLLAVKIFTKAAQESGLVKAMTTICDGDYLFSVKSPHVLETYRYNVWRETLSEVLLRWAPPAAVDAEEEASEQVMCEHVETIPRVSHPCLVFFLTNNVDLTLLHHQLRGIDLKAFKRTQEIPEVLRIILEETQGLVSKGKATQFHNFRPVKQDLEDKTAPQPKKKSPKKCPHPLADLPNTLSLNPEEFRMPDQFVNSCTKCNTLPEDEWCTRRFPVDELKGFEQYEGCVITTAPPEDRLPPMPIKGSKQCQEPHYYHPDDLKLRQIKARPEVYKQCKKDVTLLVNNELLVGAAQYQVFTQETLDEMSQHKQATDKLSSVKRGAGFRAFAWGSMKALGSHLPQGGNSASRYGPYKDMMAKEVKEIHALFSHAKVANTLVMTGQSVYSPVTKALGKHFVAHGVDPLGSVGGNLFICHNYCSPMHFDRDKTMSTCMQLGKWCKEGEWNFVFLRWGVYLDNGPNTLWLFNGNDMHVSTMPSKSTMAEARGQGGGGGGSGPNVDAGAGAVQVGGAAGDQVHFGDYGNAPSLAYPAGLVWVAVGPGEASAGYHNSVRSIDVAQASHYQRVHRQLPAVQRYWN
ncbi:hypothetical protein BDN71DRAFT_1437064 [Pleurotus eryngii]|uniref:Uncharacterized protein n=1 Tax=Pleurotus eryngii TaxID=5323 RepID=A0A9P5ZJS5_PLEER|nr:hypothetical protein BDN71DRAFT_1437064 [Pleurotus eryngii]